MNNKQIKTIKELGKISHEYPLIAELINNMQEKISELEKQVKILHGRCDCMPGTM